MEREFSSKLPNPDMCATRAENHDWRQGRAEASADQECQFGLKKKKVKEKIRILKGNMLKDKSWHWREV